jgi:hypothetical protein
MLQRIEHVAQISVARACGFGALAIVTFMTALSGDIVSCLKAGGILTLFMCLVLLLKARHAAGRSYKRTEVWIMLAPQDRPHSAIAQQVIGNVLRETFLSFAMHAAFASCLMLSGAMVYGLLLRPG